MQTPNLDEYGYIKTYDQKHEEFYLTNIVPKFKKRDEAWFDYIKKVGGTFQVNPEDSKFKKMVRMGIPDEMRPMIWAKLAGVFEKMDKLPTLYTQTCDAIATIPQDVHNQIMLDVARTFPKSSLNLDSLTKILHAFAVIHPEIGYCQSLNFIAAVCLTVMKQEDQAFILLVLIVEDYLPKEYFTPAMTGYQVDLTMITILLKERTPDVYNLAKEKNFLWIQATSNWVLTLFSNTLPMSTVLRIWDSFLLEGQKVIFRVGLAIIKMHHEELKLSKERDFGKTLKYIEHNLVDQDTLMDLAFGLKAFSRKHLMDLRTKAHQIVVEHGPQQDSDIGSGFHTFLGHMNL